MPTALLVLTNHPAESLGVLLDPFGRVLWRVGVDFPQRLTSVKGILELDGLGFPAQEGLIRQQRRGRSIALDGLVVGADDEVAVEHAAVCVVDAVARVLVVRLVLRLVLLVVFLSRQSRNVSHGRHPSDDRGWAGGRC